MLSLPPLLIHYKDGKFYCIEQREVLAVLKQRKVNAYPTVIILKETKSPNWRLATLTNARASEAGASAWVHAEDGGNEMLFPNEEFQVYDNLEKGAKVAPFTFKVPSLLPEGYGFRDLSIQFDATPSVRLSYETKISKSSGNFSLRIKPGADLQKQYEQIFEIEQDGTDQEDSGKSHDHLEGTAGKILLYLEGSRHKL
ncbi:hypothetical protein [Paenibacillus dendritiformis]|uniref:hypothetical protein n=1 Tax=Paenibacillus dendritiformis TaxID=130049 RepID=UPI00111004B7|nr:hypothetical protein [Paenibacillus dendritiformis]CAH8770823.1 hypothetical protein H7S4_003558 [Paenibacillus dendritiformis]